MDAATSLQYRLATAEAEICRRRAHSAPGVVNHAAAISLFREHVRDHETEYFLCAYLDARLRPLEVRVVGLDSLPPAKSHARDIYLDAVRMAAHSIVIAHNHPSGDTEPSCDELKLTETLLEAGSLLRMDILDHIIFTRTRSLSLASRGLL